MKKIHAVINPAAGGDRDAIAALDSVFGPAGLTWSYTRTRVADDGTRLAKAALDDGADIVAVYGGDGTVREVGAALVGTDVPLAILPGGTANVLSTELGVPRSIRRMARAMLNGGVVRPIDVGMANDEPFLVAMGTGLTSQMMKGANRARKSKWGMMAYMISGLRSLYRPQHTDYHLTIDGEEVVHNGVALWISNTGNMGLPGVYVPRGTEIDDGLLDVSLLEDTTARTVGTVFASAVGLHRLLPLTLRWIGSEVLVETPADPLPITCDGDLVTETPARVSVRHHALKVLLPEPPSPLFEGLGR